MLDVGNPHVWGELYRCGYSFEEIGSVVGAHRDTVSTRVNDAGVPTRSVAEVNMLVNASTGGVSVAKLMASGCTTQEIVEAMLAKPRKVPTGCSDDVLVRLYATGANTRELRIVGRCSFRTLRRRLIANGVECRSKSQARDVRQKSGLNAAKVFEMRVLRLVEKRLWREIADRYGISVKTCRLSVGGETWKHVPMPVCSNESVADAAE